MLPELENRHYPTGTEKKDVTAVAISAPIPGPHHRLQQVKCNYLKMQFLCNCTLLTHLKPTVVSHPSTIWHAYGYQVFLSYRHSFSLRKTNSTLSWRDVWIFRAQDTYKLSISLSLGFK